MFSKPGAQIVTTSIKLRPPPGQSSTVDIRLVVVEEQDLPRLDADRLCRQLEEPALRLLDSQLTREEQAVEARTKPQLVAQVGSALRFLSAGDIAGDPGAAQLIHDVQCLPVDAGIRLEPTRHELIDGSRPAPVVQERTQFLFQTALANDALLERPQEERIRSDSAQPVLIRENPRPHKRLNQDPIDIEYGGFDHRHA